MAFSVANLYQTDGMPPGFARYIYKSDTDTRETVMASGYFNNSDDVVNLAADDQIAVTGDKGGYTMRVDTVSAAGVVTTEMVGQSAWIPVRIASAADTTSYWAISPFDGYLGRMKVLLEGALSDDTTFGIELGGTNVTDGGSANICTGVASGSAAGDVSTGECDGANTVSEGTAIEITCGGEGSTASAAIAFVEVIPA